MAKQFIDFSFLEKKLSSLPSKYISVDFDTDDTIALGMEREMETGETNKYRLEPNYFNDKWSGGLEFDLNIIKNPCEYNGQENLEITKNEIREITRWLTSSHYPEWIQFEYESPDDEVTNYYGWFSNIENFVVAGIVYGLKLHFKCTTPFAYTDVKSFKQSVTNTYKNFLINNDSDCLNEYIYPQITIKPNSNNQMFFCNLSDITLLESGILTKSSPTYFESLIDTLEKYAKSKGYTVRYTGIGAKEIESLCNDTAVQFYLADKYANEMKCTAFYINDSTKQYKILTGGFFYLTLYRSLNIYIDTKKLIINDELGRMVTYDKLGINDVDQMYWFRLIPGNNTIQIYGDCTFEVKFREERKVGE